MGKVMLTLKLEPEGASLAEVRRRLDVAADELDEEFGVVAIDPAQNLYAVLVEEDAADRAKDREGVAGPYSNPRIEPFDLG